MVIIYYFSSDFETLAHLMKASLGTGMLSIPYVFRLSGLWFGLILTVVTSFICAHCSYIIVSVKLSGNSFF